MEDGFVARDWCPSTQVHFASRVKYVPFRQKTFLRKLKKVLIHSKGAFHARKTVRSSDIASWDEMGALAFETRFLLSKTQYSSDITSDIRIVLKKIIGGYILKKPLF